MVRRGHACSNEGQGLRRSLVDPLRGSLEFCSCPSLVAICLSPFLVRLHSPRRCAESAAPRSLSTWRAEARVRLDVSRLRSLLVPLRRVQSGYPELGLYQCSARGLVGDDDEGRLLCNGHSRAL